MKIEVNAMTLCELLAPNFTLAACEAICEVCADCGDAFRLGDLAISFSEVPADWRDEYEEGEFIELDNGNILVFN